MGFAKLDTRILDSTLWLGGMEMKLTFITALLMARPHEALEPLEEIDDEGPTGYAVPAGWYGLVEASGPGIVARAGLDSQRGLEALDRLAETEKRSFSPDFGGRRMIRTRHGYLILNFMRYRDHDHGSADRVRRYRERQRGNGGNGGNGTVTRNVTPVTPPVTQSESEVKSQRAESKPEQKKPKTKTKHETYADAPFQEFWFWYPNKAAKTAAWVAWLKLSVENRELAASASKEYGAVWEGAPEDRRKFIPHPATWLNAGRYLDDRTAWKVEARGGATKAPTRLPEVGKASEWNPDDAQKAAIRTLRGEG